VDFTHYRQSTILRRIQRRMVVHKFHEMGEYVKYVRSNPAEIKASYQDMLINVTSFFRNPRAFEALKSTVLPAIQKNLRRERGIRVWTSGCASGGNVFRGDGAARISGRQSFADSDSVFRNGRERGEHRESAEDPVS
jgi:two-component system CheB/CheR fusion protein